MRYEETRMAGFCICPAGRYNDHTISTHNGFSPPHFAESPPDAPLWKRVLAWHLPRSITVIALSVASAGLLALGYYSWVVMDRAAAGTWRSPTFSEVISNPEAYWGRPIPATDMVFPVAPPPPPDLARMKRQGCVTDGLLSGYGSEERNAKLVNALPCDYLHRAVETWLAVPDWVAVDEIRQSITRTPVVYGMFIAEALDTKGKYWDPDRGEWFNFKKMCKDGTRDRWGDHSCVPSLDEKEYRLYVTRVMKDAVDHDIQAFLFGQVYLQDARRQEDSHLPEIIEEVRAYAAHRGMQIVVGAQTGTIFDKDYLRMFDFIEGGTGLLADGGVGERRVLLAVSRAGLVLAAPVAHFLPCQGTGGDDPPGLAR